MLHSDTTAAETEGITKVDDTADVNEAEDIEELG